MSSAVAVLDRLYTSYLLRDVVGKALPGLIVLVAMAFSPTNAQPVLFLFSQVSPAGWGIVLLLALAAGFAMQALGELVGWARLYPDGNGRSRQARSLAAARAVALNRSGDAWAVHRRERYLAVKELAANFSLALLLGLLLVGLSYLPAPLPTVAKVLVALASIAAFFWLQRIEADDQRDFEQQAAGATASPRRRRAPRKRA